MGREITQIELRNVSDAIMLYTLDYDDIAPLNGLIEIVAVG